MESKKYYPPKEKEFFIGLEYEEGNKAIREKVTKWVKRVIKDKIDLFQVFDGYTVCRVKYLDNFDIESFGFEQDSGDSDFIKDEYQIEILGEGTRGKLILVTQGYGFETLFYGWVKNKSKLKEILEMVGVLKE